MVRSQSSSLAFLALLAVSVDAAAALSAEPPVITPVSGFSYCVVGGCAYPYVGTAGTPITVSLNSGGVPMAGAFAWSVAGKGMNPASGTGSTFSFTPKYSGTAIVSVTNYTPAPASVGFLITGGSPPPQTLDVSVTSSNSFPTAGTAITLEAHPSLGSGSYSAYDWNFGDQTSVTGATSSASHTYPGAGSYAVICTVHDSDDATGSGTTTINVQAPNGPVSLTVPASGSIHGVGGAFFHTDLWIKNQSFSTSATVTATYYCYTSSSFRGRVETIDLAPRESRLIPDVDASLFRAPESAGPIQLTSPGGAIVAYTRSYTPEQPAPTFGTTIPALTGADAKTRALFLGLGSNGGNTSQGYRSNAGVFNPGASSVTVTLTLSEASGAQIGTTLFRTLAPLTAVQFNDVFRFLGAGQIVTTNASLLVTAGAPVFPYVTVIDNQSGDSVFLPAYNDEAPPP